MRCALRFAQPDNGPPSRRPPPAPVAATAGARMGMRAAGGALRPGTSAGGHFTGMPTRSQVPAPPVARSPLGIPFGWPKSVGEARDRVLPRRDRRRAEGDARRAEGRCIHGLRGADRWMASDTRARVQERRRAATCRDGDAPAARPWRGCAG
jgi:hypothetical protein